MVPVLLSSIQALMTFRWLHPAHVPRQSRRRCRRRRRLACIYPGFISSRSCRSTKTDRKFLNIGWKRYCNLIRKFTVGERRALPELTSFPLFFLCARSAMIYGYFWWKRCYLAGKQSAVLLEIYLSTRKELLKMTSISNNEPHQQDNKYHYYFNIFLICQLRY